MPPEVDYDALAKQHGAIDYDALAQQHGAISSGDNTYTGPTMMPRPKLTRDQSFPSLVGDALSQQMGSAGDLAHELGVAFSKPPSMEQFKTVPGKLWNAAKGIVTGDVPGTLPSIVKNIATQNRAGMAGDVAAGALAVGAGPESEAQPSTGIRKPSPPPDMEVIAPEQQAKFTEALDKANRDHAQALADYAEKETSARQKWVQKTYEAKQAAQQAQDLASQRETLSRGADEYLNRAQGNIQQTHDAVRGSLTNRWDALRNDMEGAEVDASKVHDSIQDAKVEFLRGSPTSLKQFNDLITEMGLDRLVETEEGQLQAVPGQTMPWETARVHSSAIGEKMAGGGLPGNVYKALEQVHGAIEQEAAKAADARGYGSQYRALRKDWSTYMRDWRDMSAVSAGGSPLARALKAADPGFVGSQIMGKAGDRMVSTLAKYRQFGANPDLVTQVRRLNAQIDNLPKPKLKTAPGKYEPPTAPRLKEVNPPKPTAPPSEPKAGPITRAIGRLTGKVVGGTVGAKVGHPLIGYGVGGELGGQLADRYLGSAANEVARIMEDAKSGRISPSEADRRIRKLGGSIRIRRPQSPP